MFKTIYLLFAVVVTIACPDHALHEDASQYNKRATGGVDWAYDASYDWGRINVNYTLCQTGTNQSPIPLLLTQGLSQKHVPKFNYTMPITGSLYNWGHGPAFTLNVTDYTLHPSLTYDDTTVYLKGWHIHAPADHSVQGDRSKGELHLVHSDESGHEQAVVAIRIDPGNEDSPFFEQFIQAASAQPSSGTRVKHSSFPGFDSTDRISLEMNAEFALQEVNMFRDFWTYSGSLTSPPCREGIRFFVARQVLFVGNDQMQEILAVSTFSARVEQEVWLHGINV